MKLEDFLVSIKDLAASNGLSEPFIVGGVPRDRVLGKIGTKSEIRDIDITTGNKDSIALGSLLSQKFPESAYRTYNDGHTSLDLFGVHLDFSSNFIIPGIDKELSRLGVDITDMNRELFSRDFTINTLLEKLDFSAVYDTTNEGVGDLHAGLIRCPVDPSITIGIDARRILRAIKFAVKFGFTIESRLKAAMLENRELISYLPPKFVSTKIDEIIALDADKGIELLIEFKVLPLAQLSKSTYDILIQRRKILKAL
jgi:tRNA nucleotidyltransferase (CCA-adding enzyme)